MTRGRLLEDAVAQSLIATKRFFAGFDDSNRTSQAPGLPNHAAWQLGHMALYMHRAAQQLDGRPFLPAGDFVMGDGRSGDTDRFDAESVCFGSAPSDEPGLYPSWDRCEEIFSHAAIRLASALSSADEAALDRIVPWGSGRTTIAMLAMRMVFHNGTHAGQLVDLRRALGMEGVIG